MSTEHWTLLWRCHISLDGAPRLDIYWYKDGQAIQQTDNVGGCHSFVGFIIIKWIILQPFTTTELNYLSPSSRQQIMGTTPALARLAKAALTTRCWWAQTTSCSLSPPPATSSPARVTVSQPLVKGLFLRIGNVSLLFFWSPSQFTPW